MRGPNLESLDEVAKRVLTEAALLNQEGHDALAIGAVLISEGLSPYAAITDDDDDIMALVKGLLDNVRKHEVL